MYIAEAFAHLAEVFASTASGQEELGEEKRANCHEHFCVVADSKEAEQRV